MHAFQPLKKKFQEKFMVMFPFSQFRLGKASLQLKRITNTLPLYLKDIQFPREFQVVYNLAYDAILDRN